MSQNANSTGNAGQATAQQKQAQSAFSFGGMETQSASGLRPPYVVGFDEETHEMIMRVPITKTPTLNSWKATAKTIANAKAKLAKDTGRNIAEITRQDLVEANLPSKVGEIVVGHRKNLCQALGSQYALAPLTDKSGTKPVMLNGSVVKAVISIATVEGDDEQEG
jgi:hypothetical protein